MNPEIRKYLQQLLKDAGQKDLGAELEEEMLNDLHARLEDRLILAAMENLPQDKQNELGHMAENKENPDKIQAFLQKNIADYNGVFARALEAFRETYLGAQM